MTVTGGTATKGEGADFSIDEREFQVKWLYRADGTFSGRFGLYPKDDGIHEPDETIELTLSDPGPNTVLGLRTKTVGTIRNSPPTFVIWPGVAGEPEGSTGFQFVVERRGDREPAVSVDLRVDEADPPASGDQVSATKGVDFIPVNQRLQFASGEARKLVEIHILDDGMSEGPEFFRVALSQPSPGAVIQHGSVDWLIDDSDDDEIPALYDVTQSGRWKEAFPFVLLTAGTGPDAQIVTSFYRWTEDSGIIHGDFRPVFVREPPGGHLVFGEFTHINGVERPTFGRLLPDGELDESFRPEPSLDLDIERLRGGWDRVLPLRSGRVLLGLKSGLRRLSRDGRGDESFHPPAEPQWLQPLAELSDDSVFVFAPRTMGPVGDVIPGTNRILRLNTAGAVLDEIVLQPKPGDAGSIEIAKALWMPTPAPGRF